jgi:hypothetical protein
VAGTFETATSSLRFENGVRLDGIDDQGGGRMTGAACRLGCTYCSPPRTTVPVETLNALNYPQAQLSGLLDFTAGGSGVPVAATARASPTYLERRRHGAAGDAQQHPQHRARRRVAASPSAPGVSPSRPKPTPS